MIATYVFRAKALPLFFSVFRVFRVSAPVVTRVSAGTPQKIPVFRVFHALPEWRRLEHMEHRTRGSVFRVKAPWLLAWTRGTHGTPQNNNSRIIDDPRQVFPG